MSVTISDTVASVLLSEALRELVRTSRPILDTAANRPALLGFVAAMYYSRPELFENFELDDADEVLQYVEVRDR